MAPHLSSSLSAVNSYALRHAYRAALCNAEMRTVEEVRRLRLEELKRQYKTWAALNAAIQLDSRDSTFSQIVSAKTKKDMGSDLARRLEKATGREVGWMDTDPELEAAQWPFETIDPQRFARLTPRQCAMVEHVALHEIERIEASGKQQGASA